MILHLTTELGAEEGVVSPRPGNFRSVEETDAGDEEDPRSQSPDSALCEQEAEGGAGAEVAEGAAPLSQQVVPATGGALNPGMQKYYSLGAGGLRPPRTYPCDPHPGTMPPDLLWKAPGSGCAHPLEVQWGQSEPAELQAQVSWWGRAGGGAVAVAHRTQKCLPGRAYISPNTGGPAWAAGARVARHA